MPGHARRELSKLQQNKYGCKTKLTQVAMTSLFSSGNNPQKKKEEEDATESGIRKFSRKTRRLGLARPKLSKSQENK